MLGFTPLRDDDERRAKHPGVRVGDVERGVRWALRDEHLRPREGRREVPGGAADPRDQRSARGAVGIGENDGAAPSGDGEREAGAVPRGLRCGTWDWVDQDAV